MNVPHLLYLSLSLYAPFIDTTHIRYDLVQKMLWFGILQVKLARPPTSVATRISEKATAGQRSPEKKRFHGNISVLRCQKYMESWRGSNDSRCCGGSGRRKVVIFFKMRGVAWHLRHGPGVALRSTRRCLRLSAYKGH